MPHGTDSVSMNKLLAATSISALLVMTLSTSFVSQRVFAQQVTFEDSVRPTLGFMAPPNGAILKGHSSGVEVDINGIASDSGSGVQQVEIRTIRPDGTKSSYQLAKPSTPGDWSSWSTSRTFTQSGVYTIIGKVKDIAGNFNWNNISFTVELSDTPPDFVKPVVVITSQSDGATLNGPASGIVVTIVGTASDLASGVQKVEVRWFSGSKSSSYVQSVPNSPHDWSSWSQDLLFTTSGTIKITAKATDNAGNSQWSSRTINVLLS